MIRRVVLVNPKALRAIREAFGLSQQEFAEISGVTKRNIQFREANPRGIRSDTLEKYMIRLGHHFARPKRKPYRHSDDDVGRTYPIKSQSEQPHARRIEMPAEEIEERQEQARADHQRHLDALVAEQRHRYWLEQIAKNPYYYDPTMESWPDYCARTYGQ